MKARYIIVLLMVPVLILAGVMIPHYHADLPLEELTGRMAAQPSQWLDLDGYQVHYRDEGSGAVLLLLHGTASNLHTWREWTDTLKTRYRIIRVDLPGFGLSGPTKERDYSMAAYSRFLDRFLDALHIDSCAIAGNSLGGQIAWNYALDQPRRVRRLVLIDASGLPAQGSPSLGFRLARTPILSKLMLRISPKPLFRKSLEEVYGEPDLVTDSLVNSYFTSMLREGNRQAFIDRANTPFIDRSDELAQIAVPTLILWGERDRWIPLEHGYNFERKIPDAELMVYPGVGHVPHEEVPLISARTAEGYLCASGW